MSIDQERIVDKERIVSVLNKKHGTTLTVELLERIVAAGLSSWENLRREVSRIGQEPGSPPERSLP